VRGLAAGLVLVVAAVATWVSLVGAQLDPRSPVTQVYVSRINEAFAREGIRGGSVVVDRSGRIELKGVYEDEGQVDRAFSIAQTLVGVRWVSAVTPEHIKVKQWEECLSRIFSGDRCGPTVPVATPPDQPFADAAVAPLATKYALVVGAGRFMNGIQPLLYANKDAYDVYGYLIALDGGRFRRQNVVLLRDEHATRANVVRALDEIKRRATERDLVLVFFSSHGTPPDKYGGVHVVTYDSEVKPRERIWHTSLTDEILRDFVQSVRARRLIVVMDACYSNGAYAGVVGFLPAGGKSLATDAEEGYGRSSRYMAQRLFGAKDLVLDDAPASPGARGDGWGTVLISASNAGERSWESHHLRNSVFTRYFLEGLQRHHGFVREAFDYARPLVNQQVKREKGPDIEQNPQLMSSRRDSNMSIGAVEPSR
jgi:caspase domain-containing protein